MACAGQTEPVSRLQQLPPGTGPRREQTGFGPESDPTPTGAMQYQMDPSIRKEHGETKAVVCSAAQYTFLQAY